MLNARRVIVCIHDNISMPLFALLSTLLRKKNTKIAKKISTLTSLSSLRFGISAVNSTKDSQYEDLARVARVL
jgi:hypothetical protein